MLCFVGRRAFGGVVRRRLFHAAVSHEVLSTTKASRSRLWYLMAASASASAAAVAYDEGLRRCVEFWVFVLPIYMHYLYTDRVQHPVNECQARHAAAARDKAFERLHTRYSPMVEKETLRMRGFYLKAAQMLSMREDFLPVQYLAWTKKLQHEAPVTLGPREAKQQVASELGLTLGTEGGRAFEEVFAEWTEEPIGCASIGQVYRAKLRGGQEVAVKIQAPGVEAMFRADIKTLKFFTSFALPWAHENIKAIEKLFEKEFDYNREREHLEAVREMLLPKWGAVIRVPRPFPEHCSRRVLCMELLEGEKLIDGVRRRMRLIAAQEGRDPESFEREHLQAMMSGSDKARSVRMARWQTAAWRWWRWLRYGKSEELIDFAGLMETLMNVHGDQVFVHGMFNADPHPGNILLLKDGKTLGLIDFGQVQELPLHFRCKLAQLILALAKRDPAAVAALEQELGLETKHRKTDVRYRQCSFWLDRDTPDIMGGMNLHDFLAWGESQDPVLHFPENLYLVYRCSVMIRSLSLAFGVRVSAAEYWTQHAETLLRQQHAVIDKTSCQL